MKEERILNVLGKVDDKFISEAAPEAKAKKKAPAFRKWAAAAACLCFVIAGGMLYNTLCPKDFNSMMKRNGVTSEDTTVQATQIEIDGLTATYHRISIGSDKLAKYVGKEYKKTDGITWFYPADADNLKYLIMKASDETLSLWVFSAFVVDDGSTYTYKDVLEKIYNVNSAEDIVSITTTPSKGNNTDLGIKIQKEIGTHTYTDEADISDFYNIIGGVECFGEGRESVDDDNRFTYSFSTNEQDKLTSGESTYATRVITVTLKDGTTIDCWNYNALSGSFYEYGGIFSKPLGIDEVSTLNRIFGIK